MPTAEDIFEHSNFMLKYTKFVSQAGQAFETIEVLKARLVLKIRVSAVRFCSWPPFKF
jgi:hypothetical protein